MKTKFIRLLWFVLLLPAGAYAQVTISSTTYTSGPAVVVPSTNTSTVTTSGTVQVNSGANVSFVATTSITLAPGFKVVSGGVFRALVGVDADGDGIPNDWEYTHGLNPAVNDASADVDSDSFSNLLEYQLGTDPNSSANTADSTNQTGLNVHRPTP